MSKVRFSYFLVLLIFFLSACSAVPVSPKVVSISGEIELPLPLESNKYWLDEGPLLVVSKNPLVTYRVIDRDELDLAESEMTAYELITSSFSNPEGIFEESFSNSHKEYDIGYKEMGRMSFFILAKSNEAKAYIVGKSISSAIEIGVIGRDAHSKLLNIIDGVTLVERG